jgi:hypothetical protein
MSCQPSRPASDASPRTGGGEFCVGSLANEIALKLSQRSHHMKKEFATWGSCINILGQRDKADTSLLQRIECRNKMLKGSTQAIQFPDDERVS